MRDFTYQTQAEKDNLEAILRHRRRKFNTQQLIASVITIGIVGTLVLYLAFHIYYTEYDGYVHVDANHVRTPFDIYLDSMYVKAGDILEPGDTLYSYYMIDVLVEHSNPNSEPVVISHYRDLQMRWQNLASDVAVLRVKIQELQKQIAVEDHNISFGLSDNSHKLDLQRQLKEARAQLAALLNEMAVIGRMRDEAFPRFTSSGSGRTLIHNQQIFDDYRSNYMREVVRYRLASDSSIVTNVLAPDRMIFFEKEELMTTQHIDLEGNNLQVVAYVPIDKMHTITNNTRAKVVVNNDFYFYAHVDVLGMRTDIIPENLRSYFSKKNTAVIALFKIDEGQIVPFWTMNEGMPVSIRVRNIDTWESDKYNAKNYLWYKTGEGIMTNLPDEWIYDPSVNDSINDVEEDKQAPKNEIAKMLREQRENQKKEAARKAKAERDSLALMEREEAKELTTAKPTPTPTTPAPEPAKAEPKKEPKAAKPAKAEPKKEPKATKPAKVEQKKEPESVKATKIQTKPAPKPEAKKTEKTTQAAKQQKPAQPAATATAGVKVISPAECDHTYYIIVNTLDKESRAVDYAKSLRSSFPDVGVIKKGTYYMVYTEKGNDQKETFKTLLKTQKHSDIIAAWMWEKK